MIHSANHAVYIVSVINNISTARKKFASMNFDNIKSQSVCMKLMITDCDCKPAEWITALAFNREMQFSKRICNEHNQKLYIFKSVHLCLSLKFTFNIPSFNGSRKLIHSANPKSLSVGIIVFAHVVHPSVCPHFSNLEKQNDRKQCSLLA